MLISIFVMMVLSYHFGQKVYYIPFEKNRIIQVVLIGLIMYGLSLFINELNLMFRISIKVVLLISFVGLLPIFKIINDKEILSINRGVKDFVTLIKRKR